MIEMVIFILVVAVFLILYFFRGLYEAILITGVIATFGVIFIPDAVLFSFYIRILGAWRYVIITMNTVKIIMIAVMIILLVKVRENSQKFKGVIS